jgi:hypothetical protein
LDLMGCRQWIASRPAQVETSAWKNSFRGVA